MSSSDSIEAALPVGEVAARIAARLTDAGVPNAAVDARWLLDGLAGIDPHRGPQTPLPAEAVEPLRAAIERRCRREPLQLILGTTAFRTLTLRCRPGVFIPRPETEVVAGAAIDAAVRSASSAPQVVDVCTGSGAIACAVAAEVAGARVIATDLDPAAAALAQENAVRLARGEAGPQGLARGAALTVVTGELLDGVDPALRGHLDVLVANPPYLPAGDRGSWEPEVGAHDPDRALVGGPDGHEVVDALLLAAATWLAPGGVVVVEIDERRGKDAEAAAERAGLVEVGLVSDLTGAQRAVVARRR